MKTSQKGGALQRGLRIGKLGFGLVGSYLGYQAQNLLLSESGKAQRRARFQKKAGQRVSDELGALKGAVMKVGQLLSMQTRVFPEEALRELAALQMHAPGMHATMARAQFKACMGKSPEDVFRKFDPEPFAAASLGQVHCAITKKGEKVAVRFNIPRFERRSKTISKSCAPRRLPDNSRGICRPRRSTRCNAASWKKPTT